MYSPRYNNKKNEVSCCVQINLKCAPHSTLDKNPQPFHIHDRKSFNWMWTVSDWLRDAKQLNWIEFHWQAKEERIKNYNVIIWENYVVTGNYKVRAEIYSQVNGCLFCTFSELQIMDLIWFSVLCATVTLSCIMWKIVIFVIFN